MSGVGTNKYFQTFDKPVALAWRIWRVAINALLVILPGLCEISVTT